MHRIVAARAATAVLLAVAGSSTSAREGGAGVVASSVTALRFKVSRNGRYFVDQDGKPFFYLGDTCRLLFQRLNYDEARSWHVNETACMCSTRTMPTNLASFSAKLQEQRRLVVSRRRLGTGTGRQGLDGG